MKFLKISLAVLLFGSMGWAGDPITDAVQANVVQCPSTNDTVKAFRSKILDLKKAIKNDANCKTIQPDIDKLDKLLTTDRPKFIDLIAQGQTEGLNDVQTGSVEQYVNDLTQTTYNIMAVVTGNDACFQEDKQGSSMKFLSSVLGEGAKLLSVVGGPEVGPIIGIAGEAITGFMDAMQGIAAEHIGYDFSKDDQQISYADSLCTLYDARSEMNTMVSSAESVNSLRSLATTIQKQVATVLSKCPECAAIKGMVDAQITRAVVDTGAVQSTNQVWPKDFEDQVAAKAKEIDALYTNRVGTNLYRELKTLSWIPLRIEALTASPFNTDITLANVVGEMEDVESFMIQDQAPQYLFALLRNAQDSLDKLNSSINWQTDYLARNGGPIFDKANGIAFFVGTYTGYEDFYGKLFEGLDQLSTNTKDADVRADIQSFFADLESKSRFLDIKLDVIDKYCAFFQQADWGWRDAGLREVCNDPDMKSIKQQALLLTNYRLLMESGAENQVQVLLNPPANDLPTKSDNWADSLRESITAENVDIHYIERKSN